MKVIAELVHHFWQRGALTRQEVDYLLRHDFIRAEDLPGYRPRKRRSTEPVGGREDIVIDAPDSLELVEEELVRRKTTRRSGSKQADDRALGIAELCRRLNNEFDRRETDFASVHELGKRFRISPEISSRFVPLLARPESDIEFANRHCFGRASSAV